MGAKYQELKVWQKAMDLVVEIYALLKLLPKEEMYALSDQMRRAAVSIPSNIAEGQQRLSEKEFSNFLSFSRGSAAELETQLLICVKLGYLTSDQVQKPLEHCREIGLMLSAMINKFRK